MGMLYKQFPWDGRWFAGLSTIKREMQEEVFAQAWRWIHTQFKLKKNKTKTKGGRDVCEKTKTSEADHKVLTLTFIIESNIQNTAYVTNYVYLIHFNFPYYVGMEISKVMWSERIKLEADIPSKALCLICVIRALHESSGFHLTRNYLSNFVQAKTLTEDWDHFFF